MIRRIVRHHILSHCLEYWHLTPEFSSGNIISLTWHIMPHSKPNSSLSFGLRTKKQLLPYMLNAVMNSFRSWVEKVPVKRLFQVNQCSPAKKTNTVAQIWNIFNQNASCMIRLDVNICPFNRTKSVCIFASEPNTLAASINWRRRFSHELQLTFVARRPCWSENIDFVPRAWSWHV